MLERATVPACGGIIVAAECVDKIVGCVGATVCIPLNSLPSVGGNTVAGTVPGNVGETANKNEWNERKKSHLINYLFVISIYFK